MELRIEIEGHGHCDPLPGDGAALAAFVSFAVVRGFGAQHPFIALADRLHDQHHVRMGPLVTFYEGRVEDSEDAEKLEMAWQDAAPLRESLEKLVSTLREDSLAATLVERANAGDLAAQAEAALNVARRAEMEGKRVRMSYQL